MSQTLDLLDCLVGFDTISARPNLELIDYVQDLLISHGFRTTRLDDPDHPKAGVYAEIGPEGRGILLSAHSDVVPTEGQNWTRPDFKLTRDGDRLFGRGTTDMKGFVAAMLAVAMRADAGRLTEPLKLVLSYDEEVGCTGIARMMDRLAPLMGQPRLAVVGEPTQMHVATGHKGKMGFRAVAKGQAGHSALAPRFVNALHVAADFMGELRTIQADLIRSGARDTAYDIPYSTVHTGTFQGGTALNIVPDRAEMMFEARYLPGDDPDDLRARFQAAAAQVCTAHGADAGLEIEALAAYPGLEIAVTDPAVLVVQAAAGTDLTKVAFGTEAGFFAAHGIPTVVCGPGSMEGQGHKADEFIAHQDLSACERMLERLLAQISI